MDMSQLEKLAEEDPKALLTTGEVAEVFKVNPKTVARWAGAGRIAFTKTPGGHHRFHAGVVYKVIMGEE